MPEGSGYLRGKWLIAYGMELRDVTQKQKIMGSGAAWALMSKLDVALRDSF